MTRGRLTRAQIASLERQCPGFCDASRRQADEAAARGEAPTAAEWAERPRRYWGHCYNCLFMSWLVKGDVVEFGHYGVYVCCQCGYAFPPDCEP
jgi:hypothetical protein